MAKYDFLPELDGGFELAIVAVDFNVEKTRFEILFAHIARQKHLIS